MLINHIDLPVLTEPGKREGSTSAAHEGAEGPMQKDEDQGNGSQRYNSALVDTCGPAGSQWRRSQVRSWASILAPKYPLAPGSSLLQASYRPLATARSIALSLLLDLVTFSLFRTSVACKCLLPVSVLVTVNQPHLSCMSPHYNLKYPCTFEMREYGVRHCYHTLVCHKNLLTDVIITNSTSVNRVLDHLRSTPQHDQSVILPPRESREGYSILQ